MASIKHDIWQNLEELTMLCFSGELGAESRILLEPNSKIIYSFYAESHFDAMTKYYDFMDWGIYDTEFEIDKIPYDMNAISNRVKVRLKIDEILWEDWNSIGVSDIVSRDNEYQHYVLQILNLILQGRSSNEIAEKLYQIEIDTIGMMGDKNRCQNIAEKIKIATR